MTKEDKIKLLYIDLFCGAGGTTTGVELACIDRTKCAKVIACVNHDPNAIASHSANHPQVLHFTEDIRTLDLTGLIEHTNNMRTQYPEAKLVLWASLECTNFSKAKGGQPRDADSRTLAEHLFRYIDSIQPDYIQIENVEEFMCWGDLDSNGKPVSKDKGRCYIQWVRNVKSRGYDFDYRILNAADFGAYTSRKRFFGLFAKHGLPITFPVQTHSKNAEDDILFGQYEKWKPVRDVLDLEDEGKSIFSYNKPLCERTLGRIYAGLVKFVAGGKREYGSWILKYNSMSRNGHHNPSSLNEPCPVVSTQNRLGVVKCKFISVCYGNGYNRSLEEPAPTLTCKDRVEVITTQFIDNQYGNGHPSSIDNPSPSIVNNPKQNLITLKPWVMSTNFSNIGSDIDSPAPVITANHKALYLVNAKHAEYEIAINEKDSPMTIKIKKFMAAYGIADICMRMLKINELKRIMGFSENYKLIGTKTEQKKFIGNAVEVNMSRVLCSTLAMCQIQEKRYE